MGEFDSAILMVVWCFRLVQDGKEIRTMDQLNEVIFLYIHNGELNSCESRRMIPFFYSVRSPRYQWIFDSPPHFWCGTSPIPNGASPTKRGQFVIYTNQSGRLDFSTHSCGP